LSPQKSTPVVTLLKIARNLVAEDNSQGNLTAARAHLMNVIKDLRRLIDKGDIASDKGIPLVEGAQAILEQIQGDRPVRPPVAEDPLSLPDLSSQP